MAKAKECSLITGVEETITRLKSRGYKLYVVSEGLNLLLETHFPNNPFDKVFISQLKFGEDDYVKEGILTPYAREKKVDALRHIAADLQISPNKMIYIGDEKNDIAALKFAGLGVAFNHTKDEVAQAADKVILSHDMRELLEYL